MFEYKWTNSKQPYLQAPLIQKTPYIYIHNKEIVLPTISKTILPPINVEFNYIYPTQIYRYNPSSRNDLRKLSNPIPHVHVTNVNCKKLFFDDQAEKEKALEYQKMNPKVPVPDDVYINLTSNCHKFKKERLYMTSPATKEELDFPIAYSIMVFKDVEQIERLLRAIYNPQNYYCIHIDKKSPIVVHKALHAISNCFENIFIASESIDVQWAWYSVLEPDLVCMKDLLKYKKWKYFINLTGQEFPLKTNKDLVKILKAINGSIAMEGTQKRRNTERTEFVHAGLSGQGIKKKPFPHNISLMKGSVHIAVPRKFVHFIFNNKTALEFREWVKDTGVPDETFFSSLGHSPQLGVPGAIIGYKETDNKDYPFITRFKNWGDGPFNWDCHGKRVRMVCIWSVGDLPLIAQRTEMFANKFYSDFQPLAYDCLEELHYEKIKNEMLDILKFDDSYYRNLSFVRSHS